MQDDYAPPVLPRKHEAAEKSHCKAKPNTYVKMKGDHKWKQTYSDVFNFDIQYLILCTIVSVSICVWQRPHECMYARNAGLQVIDWVLERN